MLFHPWFQYYEGISDFSMRKVLNNNIYISELQIAKEDKLMIFAGDTEGSIHKLGLKSTNEDTAKENKNSPLIIKSTNLNYHRLHII